MLHTLDLRQLKIIALALTSLRYEDAVLEGVQVGEREFNALMDLIAEEIGAEKTRQENEKFIRAIPPDQERRIKNGNGQSRPVYIGPERRGMRDAAQEQGLTNVHKADEFWFAEDEYHEQWGWIDGHWKKLFR